MGTSKGGPSRGATELSAVRARDILRRHNYRTEKETVLVKKPKKKLYLRKAFEGCGPPHGFHFVPIGTPDLSSLCKEMSRQRGLPVDIVHRDSSHQPRSGMQKVAHYTQRIGYHFSSDIVAEACDQLGYCLRKGIYIKQSDLEQQEQRNLIARIVNQHGVSYEVPYDSKERTADQVKSAIKELFPRIPDTDLHEIFKHAWAEGTDRVGNSTDVGLARQVQLATIARIRHKYTHYDTLLKAFGWEIARKEVASDCVRKIIEWRGENDTDEDELEEIVREIIVIDDESDEGAENGSEADDEESVADPKAGDMSDPSNEVSHRLAMGVDSRPDTRDEIGNGQGRIQPGTSAEHTEYARQIIGNSKQRYGNTTFQREVQPRHEAVHGPVGQSHTSTAMLMPSSVRLFHDTSGVSAAAHEIQARSHYRTEGDIAPQERPIPSIEQPSGPGSFARRTDDASLPGNRLSQRLPPGPPGQTAMGYVPSAYPPANHLCSPHHHVEVIDLCSPTRPSNRYLQQETRPTRHLPEATQVINVYTPEERPRVYPIGTNILNQTLFAPVNVTKPLERRDDRWQMQNAAGPSPAESYHRIATSGDVSEHPHHIQRVGYGHPATRGTAAPQGWAASAAIGRQDPRFQPQSTYHQQQVSPYRLHEQAYVRPAPVATPAPFPIHGALAPVQQLPRQQPAGGSRAMPAVRHTEEDSPVYYPLHGAPAPAQLFYKR